MGFLGNQIYEWIFIDNFTIESGGTSQVQPHPKKDGCHMNIEDTA